MGGRRGQSPRAGRERTTRGGQPASGRNFAAQDPTPDFSSPRHAARGRQAGTPGGGAGPAEMGAAGKSGGGGGRPAPSLPQAVHCWKRQSFGRRGEDVLEPVGGREPGCAAPPPPLSEGTLCRGDGEARLAPLKPRRASARRGPERGGGTQESERCRTHTPAGISWSRGGGSRRGRALGPCSQQRKS